VSHRLYKRLRVVVAWLCERLYRVEVEGGSNIPRAGGGLIAANHDSSIDPALVALTTDRPIRFIARAELWQPGLRNLLDALGAIPIRRGVGDSRAMRRARRLLEAGELVAIFPQGTVLRFKNRRFRSGAARIALTTGAPLIPVRLFGTAAAFSILPPRLGFPKVHVVVGEPLPVERQEPSLEAASRLTAELEAAIAALAPAGTPPTDLVEPEATRAVGLPRFSAGTGGISRGHETGGEQSG
jgi:1-acyl-sn-glycerol-3-phosphate acyltransferase